jgi:hypothetical protein
LVHRREAFNIGEFGMLGFANANYWSNAVRRANDNTSLPHSEWRSGILQLLAAQEDYARNPEIQTWCQKHGFVESSSSGQPSPSSTFFESRAVHELCATVLRHPDENNQDSPLLRSFAEQVATQEVQILLRRALERAGITMAIIPIEESSTTATQQPERVSSSSSTSTITRNVDATMALVAFKRISSAHLQNFVADGSIVLRNVVVAVSGGNDNEDVLLLSAAAGIACRLLQTAGCKLLASDDSSSSSSGSLCVMIATTDQGAEALSRLYKKDLAAGDGICVVSGTESMIPSSAAALLDEVAVWKLQQCQKEDHDAIFVDPFYGTRGETPTSVIQWSKGTIF